MKLTEAQKTRLEAALAKGDAFLKKDFWTPRLEVMSEAGQETILALFEMFPKEIGWLEGVQMRKEEALSKQDTALWEKIVDEEEKHMAELAARV